MTLSGFEHATCRLVEQRLILLGSLQFCAGSCSEFRHFPFIISAELRRKTARTLQQPGNASSRCSGVTSRSRGLQRVCLSADGLTVGCGVHTRLRRNHWRRRRRMCSASSLIIPTVQHNTWDLACVRNSVRMEVALDPVPSCVPLSAVLNEAFGDRGGGQAIGYCQQTVFLSKSLLPYPSCFSIFYLTLKNGRSPETSPCCLCTRPCVSNCLCTPPICIAVCAPDRVYPTVYVLPQFV
jgi:hypothetical protein